MNEQILSLIKSYPTGGGYSWTKESKSDGVTIPIVYQGETILTPDAKKSSLCTGVTFQVWFILVGKFLTIPLHEMKRLQQDWYVNTGKRGGPVDALVPRGLGVEVTLNEALPGDFIQFWRSSGSGHSGVHLSHTELALTYWSSQKPVTNGMGKRTENRTGANAVIETHLVRANLPALPGTT